MAQEIIAYKIKTAGLDDVLGHLLKCDDNFIPKLSEKTDISTYSKKIVENSITFEAWINEELAGLIAAYFNDESKHSGFITNVSTISEYSGKGIGSKLMKMCIDYGIENKFNEICLEVFQKNNNAIKLYERNHFDRILVKGDLIIMKRNLKNDKG